jgi:hypothetical protein
MHDAEFDMTWTRKGSSPTKDRAEALVSRLDEHDSHVYRIEAQEGGFVIFKARKPVEDGLTLDEAAELQAPSDGCTHHLIPYAGTTP